MPPRRRTPQQAERLATVIDMRRMRIPQDRIAKHLGISQPRVSQLYAQALAEIPAASVAQHRAEELALYDDAVAHLIRTARNSATSPRTSVEAWVAIKGWCERKARLLGLDAQARVKVRNIGEVDARLLELVDEMDAQAAEHAVAAEGGV